MPTNTQKRLRREAAVRSATEPARRGWALTPVKAAEGSSETVHLGFDEGSYDTRPLCLALEGRAVETTDTPANCRPCASIAREVGREDDLKDESGYTEIYLPRPSKKVW